MAGRSKKRKTKKNILIIGEGKSEKQYLIEMKKVEKLKYALKPDLPKKSDYKYLFSFAEDNAEFYSKVYCLVDLDYIIRDDKFAQYSAIKEKTLKNKKNIEVFESYPCLETWFAFHFEYFRKTYDFCDELIKEKIDIKGRLKHYKKGDSQASYYCRLKPAQHIAITNSIKAINDRNSDIDEKIHNLNNCKLPFTMIHLIILNLIDNK